MGRFGKVFVCAGWCWGSDCGAWDESMVLLELCKCIERGLVVILKSQLYSDFP